MVRKSFLKQFFNKTFHLQKIYFFTEIIAKDGESVIRNYCKNDSNLV